MGTGTALALKEAIEPREKTDFDLLLEGKFDVAALGKVEKIATEARLAILDTDGKFRRALAVAEGIVQLRAAITPKMMEAVMALRGTSLGFLTDKDSKGEGEKYPETIVKDCFIQATLMGAQTAGNEWNIISGKPYLTQRFYVRALGELPGVTDVVAMPGIPEMRKEGEALIGYTISWKQNGQPASIDRSGTTPACPRIVVKVNGGMGPDAIIGKATRKIYAQAYNQITGSICSLDGEVESDAPMQPSKPTLTTLIADAAPSTNVPIADPAAITDAHLRDLAKAYGETNKLEPAAVRALMVKVTGFEKVADIPAGSRKAMKRAFELSAQQLRAVAEKVEGDEVESIHDVSEEKRAALVLALEAV